MKKVYKIKIEVSYNFNNKEEVNENGMRPFTQKNI